MSFTKTGGKSKQYSEQKKSENECPIKIIHAKTGRRKILCGDCKKEVNTNIIEKDCC